MNNTINMINTFIWTECHADNIKVDLIDMNVGKDGLG